jgi:hypothetical protein
LTPSPNRIANRFRDLFVLARDEARGLLDDRHLRAEASVHLRELKPDVAAADDDQVHGQLVEFEHRAVGEEWDFADAGHVGHKGAPADVDEDVRRGQQLIADANPIRPLEACVPFDDGAADHVAQALLDSPA